MYRPGLHMSCDIPADHGGVCLRAVTNAPVIVIPGRTDCTAGPPIRIITTQHCCDVHQGMFDAARYLSARERKRVEITARTIRPEGWRPDFDAVRVETMLVTTPEYRQLLQHWGEQLYVPDR